VLNKFWLGLKTGLTISNLTDYPTKGKTFRTGWQLRRRRTSSSLFFNM